MKIAIFSRTFDGVPGGVEKMVLTLASELKKLNHLLDWLESKNFNRERIKSKIMKINSNI